MIKELILTVQSGGKTGSNGKKKYRLGFNTSDSNEYFYKPLQIYLILDDSFVYTVKIACGPPSKKCYDINKKELSDWIIAKKFHCYPRGKPIRLKFKYEKLKKKTTLTLCMPTCVC